MLCGEPTSCTATPDVPATTQAAAAPAVPVLAQSLPQPQPAAVAVTAKAAWTEWVGGPPGPTAYNATCPCNSYLDVRQRGVLSCACGSPALAAGAEACCAGTLAALPLSMTVPTGKCMHARGQACTPTSLPLAVCCLQEISAWTDAAGGVTGVTGLCSSGAGGGRPALTVSASSPGPAAQARGHLACARPPAFVLQACLASDWVCEEARHRRHSLPTTETGLLSPLLCRSSSLGLALLPAPRATSRALLTLLPSSAGEGAWPCSMGGNRHGKGCCACWPASGHCASLVAPLIACRVPAESCSPVLSCLHPPLWAHRAPLPFLAQHLWQPERGRGAAARLRRWPAHHWGGGERAPRAACTAVARACSQPLLWLQWPAAS